MHIQPKYAMSSVEARRVIAEHGWARVVTCGAEGLRATYGFFLLEDGPSEEVVVVGHFARADPQCTDIEAGIPALLIFEGPHGFVSASWYRPELTDVPSTMNHHSVHLHGTPQSLDGEDRFDVLRRTLERHEAVLGKDRWRLEGGGVKLSRRIAPQTIAFRLRAERVEAKSKLSQGMPRPVRERIVERLNENGPHQNDELASLMNRLPLGDQH
ncbi:MAG: FMN-binding negative transcriptional regulator [Solirubrobacteraceae bacterium]